MPEEYKERLDRIRARYISEIGDDDDANILFRGYAESIKQAKIADSKKDASERDPTLANKDPRIYEKIRRNIWNENWEKALDLFDTLVNDMVEWHKRFDTPEKRQDAIDFYRKEYFKEEPKEDN